MRATSAPTAPPTGRRARPSRRAVSRLLAAGATALTTIAAAGGAGGGPAGGAAARLLPNATTAASPVAPFADVTWRRLVFRASKLLITATAEVELSWQPSPAVAEELEGFADGEPLAPSGETVARLAVTSQLLGRESTTQIWLDPTDLSALQRRQIELGKRERFKLYRFGRHGVYSRRVTPRSEERGQAFETWTDVDEEIVPRDTKNPVADPSALLYWLSSVEPESLRDGETIVVFSKSQLNPVEVRYAGLEDIRADYRLHGAPDPEGNAIEISERIQAHRFTLTPAVGGDELELLGLEGDLELYVDAGRRIPLRVTGRVPPVGRVSANLKAAWLAPGLTD